MLKSIFPQMKSVKAIALVPAEVAAAESISTLEKAEQRLGQIEAGLASPVWTSARRALLRKQETHVLRATTAYKLALESERVSRVILADSDNLEKSLGVADKELSVASVNFKNEQEKRAAIAARLIPLEAKLEKSNIDLEKKLAEAQAAFNSAIASGDDLAESAAADDLAAAQLAS